jgi:hypothetical protein
MSTWNNLDVVDLVVLCWLGAMPVGMLLILVWSYVFRDRIIEFPKGRVERVVIHKYRCVSLWPILYVSGMPRPVITVGWFGLLNITIVLRPRR